LLQTSTPKLITVYSAIIPVSLYLACFSKILQIRLDPHTSCMIAKAVADPTSSVVTLNAHANTDSKTYKLMKKGLIGDANTVHWL